MYRFTRDYFIKVVHDKRFKAGVQLALDESFNITSRSAKLFWGDSGIIEQLKDIPRSAYGEFLAPYSMPYLSPCVYPDEVETRKQLIDKCTDHYDPEWWCYTHECETLAVFMMFPFAKIIFPQHAIYLYKVLLHTVIIIAPQSWTKDQIMQYFKDGIYSQTDKPLILDLIGFCLKLSINWIFDDMRGNMIFDKKLLIDEKDIVSYYTSHYSYRNMDMSKFSTYNQILPN